eukprot:TRINITY_DN3509_c0_g1_i3.p1 TRINITY_DN3509_c0_g1~~TRINITY_DN3509_c0_g1_i3.p1  ORF type:complete len:243 (-),score=81.86 TRINITY_DN3509_c0_g1_i3:383-1111(-)
MMPNTSFVYGLSPSDRFTQHLQDLKSYPPSVLESIFTLMEKRYYTSPVILVEGNFTRKIIEEVKLKENENLVFGLTSRGKRDKDHWQEVIPHLQSLGIQFDTFPQLPEDLQELYLDGVFFAGKNNKGEVAAKIWNWLKYLQAKKANVEKEDKNSQPGEKKIAAFPPLYSVALIDNTPPKVRQFVEYFADPKINVTSPPLQSNGFVYIFAHSVLSPTRMLFDFSDIVAEALSFSPSPSTQPQP